MTPAKERELRKLLKDAGAKVAEASAMLDEASTFAPTPFSDLVVGFLRNNQDQAYTNRWLAQAIAERAGRTAHTLEQSALPKLALAGFPHCHQQGKRTVWKFNPTAERKK